MALVPMKFILDEANKGGYGVGAFNVNNMEQLQAICDAAAETSSPVIIQVNRNALKYADKGLLPAMVSYMAEEKYPHIPMALHLGHGPDIDTIKECIALGFTSVMIDGSLDYGSKDEKGSHPARSFEGNVAITKEAVEIAHEAGVTVEGEIGTLGGVEDDTVAGSVHLTDPEEAEEFVKQTGVGLMAVKDILSHEEIKFIIQRAREHGGYISYKADKDGKEVPYEINITWFNAISREDGTKHLDRQVKKLIVSRAIALVLQGVPGIYIHSFFGTKIDSNAASCSVSKHEINRTVIDYNTLIEALDNPDTLTSKIIHKLNSIITIRTKQSAFHPNGAQSVLKIKPEVFAVLRTSPNKDQHILSLINVTDGEFQITIPMKTIRIFKQHWYDLISQDMYTFKDESIKLTLKPYDVVWLEPQQPISLGDQQNNRPE